MDSFKSLRLGGTGPRFWHKQTVPFFNFGLFCRSPLLVGPLWFCRLWSRLGCVKVDCLVADSQYGLRLSSFVLNPALMAGLFVGLGFVVVPRALPLWCHSPSPFPLGPLCVPPPHQPWDRQGSVLSALHFAVERTGSEGEGTCSGLHDQSLGKPVLKSRCLVQLES